MERERKPIRRNLRVCTFLIAGAAIGLTLTGCPPKGGGGGGPCVPPTIDPERSLVFHQPTMLASAFSFRKTLEQIISTSNNTTPTTPEQLLTTLLDTFEVTSFVQPKSGRTLPLDPRPQEAALDPAALLDPQSAVGMVPTGLFNRFDLAPKDGSNCGEYRIVYAKKTTSLLNRFLIIFEARLPNPEPLSGIKGCKPIVDLWANLPADPAQRVAALEPFYYKGLGKFGPVVQHANYGMPFGQVRTNLFVSEPTFNPWLLREHRTALAGGAPVFVIDTVKENPLVEWYRAGALPGNTTTQDRTAFRNHFLGQPTCNLLLPELKIPGATKEQIINNIGPGFDPAGDDFQSVSSDASDDPNPKPGDPGFQAAFLPDPNFVSQVTSKLTAHGTSTVNASQLLNRAGAMTCGGCHEFSNDKDIGSGATWPRSARFVQIDEQGALSEALTKFFLPERGRILSRFVCDPTAEPKPEASCAPPAAMAARAAAARRPAVMPTPNAALVAASGLDAAAMASMKAGRVTTTLQQIDEARVAALAAAKQAQAAPAHGAAASAARRTTNQAEQTLRLLVEQAREQEQALPGAFVAVRRTH